MFCKGNIMSNLINKEKTTFYFQNSIVIPYSLGSDDAENANEGIFPRKRPSNNIILDMFTKLAYFVSVSIVPVLL